MPVLGRGVGDGIGVAERVGVAVGVSVTVGIAVSVGVAVSVSALVGDGGIGMGGAAGAHAERKRITRMRKLNVTNLEKRNLGLIFVPGDLTGSPLAETGQVFSLRSLLKSRATILL